MAPYKHIEEDLKSLKEVLEMKNQQIHQQELKIAELEKIVSLKFLPGLTLKKALTHSIVVKSISSINVLFVEQLKLLLN